MNLPHEFDFGKFRKDYTRDTFDREDVDPNPFNQFSVWFQEATKTQPIEPNAMAIATATPDGIPSVRMVLLKGFDEKGFVFYTNYGSRKGSELEKNPRAALLFYWDQLQRQVRIEGTVTRVSSEESEEYFHSRPKDAQIGAWASKQSTVIVDRSYLETRVAEVGKRFEGQEIPLPPYWGGFRVIPEVFEFWQGRKNRLHDRLRYSQQKDRSWIIERLSP